MKDSTKIIVLVVAIVIIGMSLAFYLFPKATTPQEPEKVVTSPVTRENFPADENVAFGCPGCPASAYDWALETCQDGRTKQVQVGNGPVVSCDAVLQGANLTTEKGK